MEYVLLIGLVAIYFLPAISAYMKKKKNRGAVLTLNLFLGWTLIGWIIALIWSATNDQEQPKVVIQNRNIADELEKFANLKEKGLITEQEYQAQKVALMSGVSN